MLNLTYLLNGQANSILKTTSLSVGEFSPVEGSPPLFIITVLIHQFFYVEDRIDKVYYCPVLGDDTSVAPLLVSAAGWRKKSAMSICTSGSAD